MLNEIDQCEVSRRDRALTEIANCELECARAADPTRRAGLVDELQGLKSKHSALRMQYESERKRLTDAYRTASISYSATSATRQGARDADSADDLSAARGGGHKRLKTRM